MRWCFRSGSLPAKTPRIIKSKPIELECAEDEQLCLVDSESTVNAARIEKHFPQYIKFIQQTLASKRGDSASTAGGQRLKNKGRCVVHGSVDGVEFPIPFKNMEVELTILSIRKMVRRRNDVRFTNGGGTIFSQAIRKDTQIL